MARVGAVGVGPGLGGVAMALCALLLAACGGEAPPGDPAADPPLVTTTAPPGGNGKAPTPPPVTGDCPFTVTELAAAVGGTWRQPEVPAGSPWAAETTHPAVVCHYEAVRDDGAELGVTTVEVIAEDAAEARASFASSCGDDMGGRIVTSPQVAGASWCEDGGEVYAAIRDKGSSVILLVVFDLGDDLESTGELAVPPVVSDILALTG